MALSLCMGSWRKLRPKAKYVLWCRVDQKSCFKAILHAGYEPIIVDPVREGDALMTDVETLNRILEQRGEEILCVLSTTSCFAPRSPDSLEAISGICQHTDMRRVGKEHFYSRRRKCCGEPKRYVLDDSLRYYLNNVPDSVGHNIKVPVAAVWILKDAKVQKRMPYAASAIMELFTWNTNGSVEKEPERISFCKFSTIERGVQSEENE
ncbi:putative O-phosphoseryl-tRNA(Sec) selenium transferase [Necator americanus]|uniref:O-phosphoseryl-tRNA(Sec) selenium transferase n=1 Tax=Necator americanus TaxID=51031 RepID=W2TKN9_NECAM|nr:putative O-phosphoseryl-tRNA(Sec) selenium transferase [Necator americanus]ETN81726.1 putative O-phosphoseryl-tRNA(Sec) selenium transferase [Necator americanus]